MSTNMLRAVSTCLAHSFSWSVATSLGVHDRRFSCSSESMLFAIFRKLVAASRKLLSICRWRRVSGVLAAATSFAAFMNFARMALRVGAGSLGRASVGDPGALPPADAPTMSSLDCRRSMAVPEELEDLARGDGRLGVVGAADPEERRGAGWTFPERGDSAAGDAKGIDSLPGGEGNFPISVPSDGFCFHSGTDEPPPLAGVDVSTGSGRRATAVALGAGESD